MMENLNKFKKDLILSESINEKKLQHSINTNLTLKSNLVKAK